MPITPTNMYAQDYPFDNESSTSLNPTTSATISHPLPASFRDRSDPKSTAIVPDIEVTPPTPHLSPVTDDHLSRSPSLLQIPSPLSHDKHDRTATVENLETTLLGAPKCSSSGYDLWVRKLERVRRYLTEHPEVKPHWAKIYSALRAYRYDDFMSEDDVGLFLAEIEDEFESMVTSVAVTRDL